MSYHNCLSTIKACGFATYLVFTVMLANGADIQLIKDRTQVEFMLPPKFFNHPVKYRDFTFDSETRRQWVIKEGKGGNLGKIVSKTTEGDTITRTYENGLVSEEKTRHRGEWYDDLYGHNWSHLDIFGSIELFDSANLRRILRKIEKSIQVTEDEQHHLFITINSPGGVYGEGKRIYDDIRAFAVANNVRIHCCAIGMGAFSAAGIIWCAGDAKTIDEHSHVGFHAAYRTEDKSLGKESTVEIKEIIKESFAGTYGFKPRYNFGNVEYEENPEWIFDASNSAEPLTEVGEEIANYLERVFFKEGHAAFLMMDWRGQVRMAKTEDVQIITGNPVRDPTSNFLFFRMLEELIKNPKHSFQSGPFELPGVDRARLVPAAYSIIRGTRANLKDGLSVYHFLRFFNHDNGILLPKFLKRFEESSKAEK